MFGIRMMGNVHTYAKQMQMQARWRQKQESGDCTAKLDLTTGAAIGEEQPQSLIEALTAELPTQEETAADRNKMEEIKHKLKLGGSLTREELEYLKEKDPKLYEEYVQAEEERKQEEKAYKEALKQCKTREEVERLKSTTLNKYMTRMKSIANNPNIEPEVKAIKIGAEKRKADDVDRNTKEFVRKGEYKKLPTEAEVREAEKAEAEEQRIENGLSPDGIRIVEEKDPVQKPQASGQAGPVGNSEKPDAAKREKPEIDVEPDARRKVRRAKAKAAYAYAQDDSGGDPAPGWSAQA